MMHVPNFSLFCKAAMPTVCKESCTSQTIRRTQYVQDTKLSLLFIFTQAVQTCTEHTLAGNNTPNFVP